MPPAETARFSMAFSSPLVAVICLRAALIISVHGVQAGPGRGIVAPTASDAADPRPSAAPNRIRNQDIAAGRPQPRIRASWWTDHSRSSHDARGAEPYQGALLDEGIDYVGIPNTTVAGACGGTELNAGTLARDQELDVFDTAGESQVVVETVCDDRSGKLAVAEVGRDRAAKACISVKDVNARRPDG